MVRLIVFVITIFSFGTINSQNYIQYHNLCNEGCQLIDDGLYVEAKDKILDAIDLVDEPLSVDYFNLAKCYSQLYSPEATLYYLELSLKLTNRGTKKYIEHSLWFEPVFGKEKWKQMLAVEYVSKDSSESQLALLREVDVFVKLRNKYMSLYHDSIIVYHPYDSVLIELYKDSLDFSGRLVSDGLENIILKYGWPGEKLTGWGSLEYLFVDGRSSEWFYKMEEKLIAEIDKGNLYPWVFADMADRAYGNSDLPCRYGTIFCDSDVTPEIEENCKRVGAPLGKVKSIRRLN